MGADCCGTDRKGAYHEYKLRVAQLKLTDPQKEIILGEMSKEGSTPSNER